MRCIRDVYGSEVQGEVHTRAGSILRIGSGSGLGVHDIPIRVQKRGLVPPLPRSDPTTDDLKSRVEFAGGTTVIRVK